MSEIDTHERARALGRDGRSGRPARLARRGRARCLCLLLAAGGSAPAFAHAQLPTLPHAPDPFRTNALDGPDNEARLMLGSTAFGDDSGIRAPLAIGVRRRLLDGVTLHAAAGTYRGPDTPEGRSTRAQLGAALDVLLTRSRATLSAHGGFGYLAADDGRVVAVPVGVGATVEVARAARLVPAFESTGGPSIYLWALPRLELLARRRADVSETDVVGGGSIGLGVSSSEGVGILVGLDARSGSDDAELPSVSELTWGLSLRYRF